MQSIHDVFITEGTKNGDKFTEFVEYLLPQLLTFNEINPYFLLTMDVQQVTELIENRAGVKILFLLPYSPNLNPVENVFSQET